MNLINQKPTLWLIVMLLASPLLSLGQTNALDSADLKQIIDYAIDNQPALKQAQIDQEITEKTIRGKLADWYPQINFAYNYQHYTQLQKSIIGGNVVRFGVRNTSYGQLNATQNVFNRDALLALTTKDEVKEQSSLLLEQTKVDLIVNVSKAFYDALASMQQVKVTEESVARLKSSVEDAYDRYTAGVADKTDYKRASIQLSNAEATLKTTKETLTYKMEYLKSLIGSTPDTELVFEFNNSDLENEILLDTTEDLDYANHIDYQVLSSQKNLQDANVQYSNWAFIPNISLFGYYNRVYQNNNLPDLYSTAFPNSYFGASLTFPIFQGGKRVAEIQKQKLSGQRLDVGLYDLGNAINTEYTRSMSAYKSNLSNYYTQKENVELAQEVYDVIQAQYQNGIRTYLDVIIAESDLNTTQINYFNALYAVLSSKMDVLKALGKIN